MMNPLVRLNEYGQSPWLDYIDRDLLESGALARMVTEDGLRGVTSNPSIFAKAVGKGTMYDEAIRAVVAEHRTRRSTSASRFGTSDRPATCCVPCTTAPAATTGS